MSSNERRGAVEKPVAIFADQIAVGMTVEHPSPSAPQYGGRVRVTQVRRDGDDVAFLGEREEDGAPFTYRAGASMAWLCHHAPLAPDRATA
jgi:hypothetical protein